MAKTSVQQSSNPAKTQARDWVEQETTGCEFGDRRLDKRFARLVEDLWRNVGQPIPYACQDWANTKAAYRFLSNDKVNEADILSGHFDATRGRAASACELSKETPLLVLHDTTEFTYKREPFDLVGVTNRIRYSGRTTHTVGGILMHSSLAVTTEGVPLGLSAVKFWTRDKFKGTRALAKKVNPTRIPIESKESYCWLENIRQTTELMPAELPCVHIGDRGSDIYELFCLAKQYDTHFLVRTCVDRLAGDGNHTVSHEMKNVPTQGYHTVSLRDKAGNVSMIKLALKYKQIQLLPPIGKQKQYPPLTVTVLHATEVRPPKKRAAVQWKLLTDLPIQSLEQAIEKLDWYAMRWKIELFHKILKSGCKAEDSKLRTAQRLSNIIAVFCIIGWRIFWMTMLNRSQEKYVPLLALTKEEIRILDQMLLAKDSKRTSPVSLSDYLIQIAKLGGYLARASDPPPGNLVMWRGLARLADIQLGFSLANRSG